MSASKLGATIHRLQDFNFTTLILNSTSSSSVPFQKCCGDDQLYSVSERKCVFYRFNTSSPNSDPRPDSSKFEVHNGFPRLYADYWCSETNLSWIQNFFYNGSVDIHVENEETTYHFKRGEYCFDVEKETFNPLLITGDQLLPVFPVQLGYLLPYLVSLLLVLTTLSLYLAMAELHVKVKDKCFICYVASLMLWMIIYADVWEMNGISFLKKFVSVDVSLSLEWYIFMVTFCWLNVMCIHLWRTVTTVNSISTRSFNAYALYALGLPLICKISFSADRLISGPLNFSHRVEHGGLFSNPILLYTVSVCCVQQIINIIIFFRVGFIIWDQKRRWNRSTEHIKIRRHCQEKTMFSQLLRLFIIVDLEWIYIFISIYLGIIGSNNTFTRLCFWVKLSPGYFIFVVYVCFNKQVISSLRRRFPRTKNLQEWQEGSSQNNPSTSLTLHAQALSE